MTSLYAAAGGRRALGLRDLAGALAAGLGPLALYVATLQPDLGGPEDTPKFQFLGYVLGTAHPPGYPLYVLLTHAFVTLPIGTIAYRANLFSAVMAAVACALAYGIARQIGASRWSALCAALGLATGAAFWRSAVFAEVYSLAAVTTALGVSLLLAWGARGRAALLLGAVAALSLGAGNHLTIAGLVPPFVIYVLARNRHALTAPVVALGAGLIGLGLAQYGFIILRTAQGAPYLESGASSLSELVRVVTAERFAGQRFAFGPSALLTIQIPTVARTIGYELGLAGLAGLGVGLVAARLRSRSEVALLAGSIGGLLVMVVNLSGDVKGFVTPVMVLVWPIAGLGFDALAESLASPRGARRAAAALALAGAAAMPVGNLVANYHASDHSGDTADARLLRGIYGQLPDRAAIVVENYFYDMGLHYLMLTGEGGPDRGIRRIGFSAGAVRDAAGQGRRVFGFAGAATYLAAEGLRFERAPLAGPALGDWLRTLPRGTVIAGAGAYAQVPAELVDTVARGPGRSRSFAGFARIVGRAATAWTTSDEAMTLDVTPGVLGSALPPFPGAVRAAVDEHGARIDVAGRTVAASPAGLAIAAFTPSGTLALAFDLPADGPFEVPFQGSLYELKGESPCTTIAAEWTDVTPVLSTGSWVATMSAVGSVAIETVLVEPDGAHARSIEMFGGGMTQTTVQPAGRDGTVQVLTVLGRAGEGRPVFRLAFDRAGLHGRARIRPGSDRSSVTVCAHTPLPLFINGDDRAVLRPDFESEAYFGAGWSDAERLPTGRVRRARDRAALLLPLASNHEYRLTLDLTGPSGTRIDVTINGAPAGDCRLGATAPCEVVLPASAVRDGVDTLLLAAQRPVPVEGFTIQGARLVRHPITAGQSR